MRVLSGGAPPRYQYGWVAHTVTNVWEMASLCFAAPGRLWSTEVYRPTRFAFILSATLHLASLRDPSMAFGP